MICAIFQQNQKNILDYLLISHGFIYRTTFHFLSQAVYWQLKYVQKYLKNKQNLSALQKFFMMLIDITAFNIDELNNYLKMNNLFDTNQQLQIFQSYKNIKAYYFDKLNFQDLVQTDGDIQEVNLYSNGAYLVFNTISNRCFARVNQSYFLRKDYRQDLLDFKLVFYIDTLRDTDFIDKENCDQFFQIMNNYYSLFNKFQALLSWQNLQKISYYLSNYIQRVSTNRRQELVQLNIKFNSISLSSKCAKSKWSLQSIIHQKLNSYLIFSKHTIQQLGNQQTLIMNKHQQQQQKMIQKYLNYQDQLKQTQTQSKYILFYKLILSLIKAKEPKQTSKVIRQIFQSSKIYQAQDNFILSAYILLFTGRAYYQISQIEEEQKQIIKKQFTSFFFKAYGFHKDNCLQKFELILIISIIYQKKLSKKLFSLLLERGAFLKHLQINFSNISIMAVRQFIKLDKMDLEKKKQIMGWSLQDVSYNVYKAAFCLQYLNPWTFSNSDQLQIKRLFILCVRAISTVDFGFNHIQQEIKVWNQMKKYLNNKKSKKYKTLLSQLVRRWCRYTSKLKYTTSFCSDNEKQFVALRQKLRKQKKRYLSNSLKQSVCIIEHKFHKKMKKMHKCLEIKMQ